MTQPPTNRQEFERWLNMTVEKSAHADGRGFKVAPGPSIIELINNEINTSTGDYRDGLEIGLFTIQQANRSGSKPFYALTKAVAAEELPGVRRGIETTFFIFKTPYKWIAGERP